MHFTLEQLTSGRVLAPVPTLLVTPNRGNHGGIAPTKIGEPTPGKWTGRISLLGGQDRIETRGGQCPHFG
ncbi:hypothetical protein PROH_11770 [Prochlorothrix hollandica PCC 9006 = CALU 1027]|uniref:Uncharacterized protein n=1 Tax=Prochlorothrix hollandica PCC 9006 = CALU 1027 TaxID=317619 RepID=A0A0M2PV16_PROHO|nr:hypothetical protein PROH_11770 [Prochlorothrix hollandica PCC 9006 = CALU 1027]